MSKARFLIGLFLLAAALFAPLHAQACPACTEMVAASTDVDDADNFAGAMNESIYVMLGVPFSALFVVGFMIYRGVKQNEAYREEVSQRVGVLARCGA